MTEVIKEFILKIFGDNAWLGIIIIAMIPVIELRGAIPFALSSVWGASKLGWFEAYVYSVVGATLPALIIIPLLVPVFNFLKKTKLFKKVVELFEKKFTSKSEKIENDIQSTNSNKNKEWKKFVGVMTFVAIPLPLTGAWTGSAVAAYLKMGFWQGVFAVLCGNIISGGVMTLLCLLLPQKAVDKVLYAFIILAAVLILAAVIVAILKSKKQKNKELS